MRWRELLADAKEAAEHVMLIDLGRNDVGRVAATGTVRVDEQRTVERYSHVMHLVSNVSGRAAPGRDAFDALRACFPAGTLTGAPKIRAMEILERIEPVRRHIYTGSIGYLDWRGDADWSIAIRTLLVTADAIRFAAGGGITAGSEPISVCGNTTPSFMRVLPIVGWRIVASDTSPPQEPRSLAAAVDDGRRARLASR